MTYHQAQNFFMCGGVMHLNDKFMTSIFASDQGLYDKLLAGFNHKVPAKQCKTLDDMKTILKYVSCAISDTVIHDFKSDT